MSMWCGRGALNGRPYPDRSSIYRARTVTGQKEIALVIRRESQVQDVTEAFLEHQVVRLTIAIPLAHPVFLSGSVSP